MAEKITFDDAAGVLSHSVTVNQLDDKGVPMVGECRVDHNAAGLVAVRRDPAFEAKLSAATRKKITDREAAINAAIEAEAAARIAAQEGGM